MKKETDLPEEKKQAIRPEELRIGNLISSKVNQRPELKVLQLFGDSFQADWGTGRGGYMYESCEGIPLSPEWMERLGFRNEQLFEAARCWRLDYFALGYHAEHPTELYLHGYRLDSQVVRYVHQLQNLYFSLTGEELKLEGVC